MTKKKQIDTVSEWFCENCGQLCWCSIPICMKCGGKMLYRVRPRKKYERKHDVEVYILEREK